MSAFILRIRDALNEAESDWQWSFSPSPNGGESKFKFVARQKQTGMERTVFLAESVLYHLPLKIIVHDIIRLLPPKVKAMTMDTNASINVGEHYAGLLTDYRNELEKMRRLAQQS